MKRNLYTSILSSCSVQDLKDKHHFTDQEINKALEYGGLYEIYEVSTTSIQDYLEKKKQDFISENDFWDSNMFIKYSGAILDMLKLELNQILTVITEKKYSHWKLNPAEGSKDKIEYSYYIFNGEKLDGTGIYNWMVITTMSIPKLNWYILSILKAIDDFCSGNTDVPDRIKTKSYPTMGTKPKVNVKHYVLAYIFDCKIEGINPPIGYKKDLETIGKERMKGSFSGNTFYKQFNEIYNKDLESEKVLIGLGSLHWKKIIIALSQDPKRLESYLEEIGL